MPVQTLIQDDATKTLVTYQPNFLNKEEADAMLDWMLYRVAWENETVVMFGVPRTVLRKTYAFGNPGLAYRYSGTRKQAHPWPPVLGRLLAQLRFDHNAEFNFALANMYPDGSASIGAHADDESDIVKGSPIVGISLGATRDFILTTSGSNTRVASVPLEHGSAIVMAGETQRWYRHAVPARKRVGMPRVSLTFRVMKG